MTTRGAVRVSTVFVVVALPLILLIFFFTIGCGCTFSDTEMKMHLAQMKFDLRRLVDSEEVFFRKNARYTASPGDLNFKAAPGVDLPTIVASKDSWSATSKDMQQFSGATCGIAVHTTNPVVPSAPEGEPACHVPKEP